MSAILKITNVSSSITSHEGSVKLDSSDDITITGSNLQAAESIDLKSTTGNITIQEATNSQSVDSKEKHASAEISATVQNEYVEIGSAIKAAVESAEQLKKVKEDYQTYKRSVKELEASQSTLKQQYRDKVPGVDYSDIEDLGEVISNINIATDSTKDTSVTVRGSNINASDTLNINTHDLNVVASTDTASTNSSSKDISGSVSMTVYGAASGPQVSLGYGQNESRSNSTTYTNSTLTGNTVNLNATNDATLKGATVRAEDTLNVNVGNNLEVASVQDTSSSSNHGMNISGGFGVGSDSTYGNKEVGVRTGNGTVASVNGGVGASNGRSYDTQTVLTSLTGDSVNVTTGKDTKLSGAVIAATDANGNDTGKLGLSTNTLTTENLTDTHYNSATGFSIGANIGLTPETKDPKPDTKNAEEKTTTTINSPRLAFNTSRDISVGKTLATVGEGNIAISDTANSTDTTNLNRDVAKVDKELYSSSTGTKVDATLDTRLLSKTGQKQIAEDFLKTGMIVGTIAEIATNSTVGIGDFKDEIIKRDTTYEAVKQKIATDKNLAEILANPAYTDAQKDTILNGITNEVLAQLGYKPVETKLIATTEPGRDGKQVKGYYSTITNSSYVNDLYNNSNYDLLKTSATEGQRAIDAQNGSKFDQSKEYRDERADYSQNFGSYIADYTDFALGQSDQGSLSTQTNQSSVPNYVTMTPSVFNNEIANNNLEFAGLNKTQGDNLVFNWGFQGSAGAGASGATSVGKFMNFKYENGKLISESGRYWNVEGGAGSPAAGGGIEAGVMFTDDVRGTFAGSYINQGGALGPIGVDITNTTIDSKTKKSTTGVTINGSIGPSDLIPVEGHVRIGKTNIVVEKPKTLIDFNSFINMFK